jgi:peptidoglycan/LPS O-acetylase OafA/YrhL
MPRAGEDDGLTYVFRRFPAPVRVAALLAWATVAAFAKWQGVNGHDVSPWVWVILAPGLAIMAIVGVVHFTQSFGSPVRRPFDPLNPGWGAFFVITGSLLVLGPLSFFDDDPETDPTIGGIMFIAGAILLVLFVLHLVKPVREDADGGFK